MDSLVLEHRHVQWWSSFGHISGVILGMGLANERRRYNVTSSLIGWPHTQNDPCICAGAAREVVKTP